MKATLSCDHRVVDGAVGARWMKAFKSYLEVRPAFCSLTVPLPNSPSSSFRRAPSRSCCKHPLSPLLDGSFPLHPSSFRGILRSLFLSLAHSSLPPKTIAGMAISAHLDVHPAHPTRVDAATRSADIPAQPFASLSLLLYPPAPLLMRVWGTDMLACPLRTTTPTRATTRTLPAATLPVLLDRTGLAAAVTGTRTTMHRIPRMTMSKRRCVGLCNVAQLRR